MFNLYLKMPADLVERSRSSVLVSILAITIMTVLCIAEVREFWAPPFESTLVVEPHRFGRLAVHLSLDLHNVPCKMVNIELKSAVFARKPATDATKLFIQKPLTGTGCRVTGSARLDKSAGNVRIYFGNHDEGRLVVPKEELNLSHAVRYLSFTDELEVSSEVKLSGPSGGYHPLVSTEGERAGKLHHAGQRLWEMYGPQDDQTAGMHSESNQHHDYNLQLVPTISAQGDMGYQYTWTEDSYASKASKEADSATSEGQQPLTVTTKQPLAVTFHFQLSPITVKSQRRQVTPMGLMMRLWSIVGGVYVMCMLLDRVLHSSKPFMFGRNKTL